MTRILLPLLFALVLPATAGAEAFCARSWSIAELEGLRLAAVAPGVKRLGFVSGEGAACPSEAPACQTKAYLVAGDEVVVNGTAGAYSCAIFVGPKGRLTFGFLPSASLVPREAGVAAGAADWVGTWTAGEHATIEITRAGPGRLKLSGSAVYPTLGGSVNVGDFEEEAAPSGGTLGFGDQAAAAPGDCAVRLRRLGRYLVAADNLQCGGHNVSFADAYARTK